MLSPESKFKEYSRLIRLTFDRFNLNFDPEQALTFYVACRGALLNNEELQKVYIYFVF